MAFTTFVLFQMFNVFNARTENETVFTRQMLANRKLLLAIGSVVVLQVLAVEWGPLQNLFETESLSWAQVAPVLRGGVDRSCGSRRLRKLGARALAAGAVVTDRRTGRALGERPRAIGRPSGPAAVGAREHLDELLEAAVEAEIETGEREETVAAGRAQPGAAGAAGHPRRRSWSCVGISLLVLPGARASSSSPAASRSWPRTCRSPGGGSRRSASASPRTRTAASPPGSSCCR